MDSHSLHIAIHTPAMAAPSGSDGHCRIVLVKQSRLLDRYIGANPSTPTTHKLFCQIPLPIVTGLTRACTDLGLEIGAGGKKAQEEEEDKEERGDQRGEK